MSQKVQNVEFCFAERLNKGLLRCQDVCRGKVEGSDQVDEVVWLDLAHERFVQEASYWLAFV